MLKTTENNRSKHKYILIVFIILLGLIIIRQTRPYMSGFLGAATLYAIVIGQHRYLTQKLKIKKGLSALLILLEVLIFILIPITAIAFLVIDTFSGININPAAILDNIIEFINSLEERIGIKLFTPENLAIIPKAGSNIVQILANSIYSFLINIVVILFVLYYMLYNNRSFEQTIWEMLPFEEENKQILAKETALIIRVNAVGIPLMAILQGFAAYLGYLFFGIDGALLYGILTGFASILPVVGTMVIWIPLVIGLFLGGDIISGVGLLIYGSLIIGSIDNVARLLLQKKLASIHPLITLFGVFIGIPMFGFWGVIFGPLLLSLFMLFLNMYRHQYVPGSKAQPRITTRIKAQKIKLPKHPLSKLHKKKSNEPKS